MSDRAQESSGRELVLVVRGAVEDSGVAWTLTTMTTRWPHLPAAARSLFGGAGVGDPIIVAAVALRRH